MKPILSYGHWFLELFNPPPRDLLSFRQKIGRIFLVTVTLFTFCILSAIAAGLTVFLWQRLQVREVSALPMLKVAAILLDSLLVNVACVFVLLQIKRLDENLIGQLPGAPRS